MTMDVPEETLAENNIAHSSVIKTIMIVMAMMIMTTVTIVMVMMMMKS